MSKDEEIAVAKLLNRGWNWESRLTLVIATIAVISYATQFYFNITNSVNQHTIDIRENNDRVTRVEIELRSKVSVAQFEDFRADMKTDMRDLKMAILKNYDKK